MAEHLIIDVQRLGRILAGLAAVIAVSSAVAQELADPTRPPAVLTGDGMVAQQTTVAPVLQSVLVSPTRRQAIISGQAVKVGDKVGEAKVIKITENEVVLRNGKELQTLRVFPRIEKRAPGDRDGIPVEKRRQ